MIGTAWAAGEGAEHALAFYLTPEFWVAVAFVIFMAIASKAAWKTITGMLDARTAAVTKQLADAQKLRDEAQAMLTEYQGKQLEAVKDAEGIVAQAKAEAERMKQKAQTDLEATIRLRERQAMDRIAQAEVQATADVRNAAVDAAIAATQMLLKERLESGQSANLVDQAIAELPQRLH